MIGRLAKALSVIFDGGIVSVEHCTFVSNNIKQTIIDKLSEVTKDLCEGSERFKSIERRLDNIEQVYVRLEERTKDLPQLENRILDGVEEIIRRLK